MSQNQKFPKIKSIPKLKVSQNPEFPKIKRVPKSKVNVSQYKSAKKIQKVPRIIMLKINKIDNTKNSKIKIFQK